MEEEEKQNKFQDWLERVKHPYRLVVMNNDTFEEVGSYKLTLLNIYIILSSIVMMVAIFVVLAIIFTPAKRFIPGYGDVSAQSEMKKIYESLDSIEYYANATDTYQESIQRVLTGNSQTAPDEIPEDLTRDTEFSIEVSEEEMRLRDEVALETLNQKNKQSKNINTSPNDKPLEQLYFTSPLSGDVSAGFMPEKKHLGIDILAPKGTPIKSVLDGYVVMSDWTRETGQTIGIQHANNVVTFYKHNSTLLKKAGEFVKAGEAIAVIGNTGDLTDGPHLHFELWYKGQAVDPAEYVRF
jgi:murein DD-endopeptidase MepM/ murein hydrolase activator NlpD